MSFILLYPLFLYLLICIFAFLIFNFREIITTYFPLFFFLLFLFPSIINILFNDYYDFKNNHFSALNFISESEFILNVSIYFFCVLCVIIFYKLFVTFKSRGNILNQIRLEKWVEFTAHSKSRLMRCLIIIAAINLIIGLFLRFGFYSFDQFVAPLKGDSVANISAASYGRSQVLETIFFMTLNLIFYISIEFRKRSYIILFSFYFIGTAFYVGSKAGILVFVFWAIAYAFFRRIIPLKPRYIFLFLLIALPSFIIGDYTRTFLQGVELDGEATLSLFGWVENIAKRDVSIAQTTVMINDPNFYSHLTPEYIKSFFGLAIPSFIWPDKPISPGYAIAELFGFGVQSAAPGWLGGFMFLFGHMGLILGPILVAFTLAFISNKLRINDQRESLHYPLIYMILIELWGFFMDGGYHSLLPTFIALFICFSFFYFLLLLLNLKFPLPPIFRFLRK
tara:strand:- start:140 stop:1492 length:1353 start_codon:yes stop_codon:yes gene_type:complete